MDDIITLVTGRGLPFVIALVAFSVARIADYGQVRAVAIAAIPFLLAWGMTDPAAHDLFALLFSR